MSPGTNSAKSIVARQQYAIKMLQILERGKRVINIDETWLNETGFVRRTWAPRDGRNNAKLNSVSPRLSMIATKDTDGRVWFSLGHANTDSNVIVTFLHHLVQTLDRETPGWKEETWLVHDNAPYFSS